MNYLRSIFVFYYLIHGSTFFAADGIEHVFKAEEVSLCRNSKNSVLSQLVDADYDHDKLVVYKFLDTQKCSYIVFIKDDEGNHYVVKQEKYPSLSKQIRSIAEALCAHIASSLSIPSQQVKILPVGMSFPGKFITKRVGTVHTLVPGNTIRANPDGLYGKLDIKQPTDNAIPFEQQGFTERTIFWMSQHPDLPLIVALDTFVGNKDRNKANILYDSESNSFYAIDMALIYDVESNRKPVAQVACEQVTQMIINNAKFTEKELEALRAYRSMLKRLVSNFPPKVMCALLDNFFIESKIVKTHLFSTKDIMSLLNAYKRAIKQSYVDIKKLIYLLFVLMNR